MNRKSFTVEIDEAIADNFDLQVQARGYLKYRSIQAAIKLWLDLPVELQARLLDASLNADSLVTIVEQIVDGRIESGRKAARKLLGNQQKKPGRKG